MSFVLPPEDWDCSKSVTKAFAMSAVARRYLSFSGGRFLRVAAGRRFFFAVSVRVWVAILSMLVDGDPI